MFNSFPQISSKFSLEKRTETNMSLQVESPSFASDFNRNYNVLPNINITPQLSALKMETVFISETSDSLRNTWWYNPEDCTFSYSNSSCFIILVNVKSNTLYISPVSFQIAFNHLPLES